MLQFLLTELEMTHTSMGDSLLDKFCRYPRSSIQKHIQKGLVILLPLGLSARLMSNIYIDINLDFCQWSSIKTRPYIQEMNI